MEHRIREISYLQIGPLMRIGRFRRCLCHPRDWSKWQMRLRVRAEGKGDGEESEIFTSWSFWWRTLQRACTRHYDAHQQQGRQGPGTAWHYLNWSENWILFSQYAASTWIVIAAASQSGWKVSNLGQAVCYVQIGSGSAQSPSIVHDSSRLHDPGSALPVLNINDIASFKWQEELIHNHWNTALFWTHPPPSISFIVSTQKWKHARWMSAGTGKSSLMSLCDNFLQSHIIRHHRLLVIRRVWYGPSGPHSMQPNSQSPEKEKSLEKRVEFSSSALWRNGNQALSGFDSKYHVMLARVKAWTRRNHLTIREKFKEVETPINMVRSRKILKRWYDLTCESVESMESTSHEKLKWKLKGMKRRDVVWSDVWNRGNPRKKYHESPGEGFVTRGQNYECLDRVTLTGQLPNQSKDPKNPFRVVLLCAISFTTVVPRKYFSHFSFRGRVVPREQVRVAFTPIASRRIENHEKHLN